MRSALQLPYICPSKASFAVLVFAKAGTTTIKAWAAHQGEGDFNGTVVEARPAAGLEIGLKIRRRAPVLMLLAGAQARCFLARR